MQMNALKRVSMIILMQKDLEAAVAFYKKLGVAVVFHVKDKWAELQLGDIQIGLCPIAEHPGMYRTGIVFEVENLKEMHQAMKDQFSFLNEPVEAPHGVMISLQDPSGNIFDLYQPTPEKLKEYMAKNQTAGIEADGCCSSEQSGPEVCCKEEAPTKSSCC